MEGITNKRQREDHVAGSALSGGPGQRVPGGPDGGGAAALACYKGHISPRRAYAFRTAGQVVELKCSSGHTGESKSGRKGELTEWSMRSRRNCWKQIAALPWERYPAVWFITLTYPGLDASEYIPKDGSTAKRHLQAFLKRWGRVWGKPEGVWKMEFQRRGALHFHLWIVVDPDEVGLNSEQIHDRREWCAEVWYQIVGSESRAHRLAGTQVVLSVGSNEGVHPMRYFKAYLSRKHTAKEVQNRVPLGFTHPGRFWGKVGGFTPDWTALAPISLGQFVRFKRLFRKYLHSKHRRRKRNRRGAICGMFVVGGSQFITQVKRSAQRASTKYVKISGGEFVFQGLLEGRMTPELLW